MRTRPTIVLLLVLVLLAALVPAPAVAAPRAADGGASGVAAMDTLTRVMAAGARPLAAAGQLLPDRIRDWLRLGRSNDRVAAPAALPHQVREQAAKPLKFKRVGELSGRRTARARNFQLEDGQVEAELSAAPVNCAGPPRPRHAPLTVVADGFQVDAS